MLYWSAPLDLVLCCRPNRGNMLFDSGELGQVRGLVVSTSGSFRGRALFVPAHESMGSPIDLTLGCSTPAPNSNGYRSDVIHKTGSAFLGGHLQSLRKAQEYLRSLEEERLKVESFKRELPSCIQLLEDAIQALREKLASGQDTPTLQLSCSSMDSVKERNDAMDMSRPTLKEFLPLERPSWGPPAQQPEGSDVDTEGSLEPPMRGTNRPAWMTEAHQNSASTELCHAKEKEAEILEQEQSSTGAFLPFLYPAAAGASLVARPTPMMAHSGVGLSLSFGEGPITSLNSSKAAASDSEAGSIDVCFQTPDDIQIGGKDVGVVSNGTSGAGSSSQVAASKRKARRCWSPELHRRFVSALEELGGAEVATPKQICELMKVDGLTNDEVKSHLQKYRLHTRRSSPSPQSSTGAQSPQLVVLGGIWVPPKYTLPASHPSPSVHDSSTGHPSQPTQFYQTAALPQDHYLACISNGTSEAPVQMHRQPLFESQQAASQSQTSPQGSTQGPNIEVYHDDSGGEEEAKSAGTSWKTESCQGEEVKKSGSESTSN